jgi:hypothetical protein
VYSATGFGSGVVEIDGVLVTDGETENVVFLPESFAASFKTITTTTAQIPSATKTTIHF